VSSGDVWLLGAAMTRFGGHPDTPLAELGAQAARAALDDAGVTIHDIGVFAAGNQMEAATRIGQRVQRHLGQTGIPVYNVINACATGATALRTAVMAVRAGECDLGLALGVEKIAGAGLLGGAQTVTRQPTWVPQGPFGAVMPLDGELGTESMPGMFAMIGLQYGLDHGAFDVEVFARISEKNHAHSTLNPLATYRNRMTLEQITGAPMVAYPNTVPMCSANCDGAAAAVVVGDDRLRRMDPDQRRRAVKITASILTSDPWEEGCDALPDFNTLTRNAARQAYAVAGVEPADLDLVELHDCFATAELVHYDNLMLCPEGEAVAFFESGATWRDGKLPVNVSGGPQSKGHPIAATGLAGIYEIATHLRGEAGDRQVEGATVGMAHVAGLGQSCGVHILERGRG
jgi:acetyl-CoA acetyltransferase